MLAGEVDDDMVKGEDHDDDSNASELEEDAYTPESLYENKRARKPPVWLQDYVRYWAAEASNELAWQILCEGA